MYTCKFCSRDYPSLSDFVSNGRSGYYWRCKECKRQYDRAHYQKTKKRRTAKKKETQTRLRDRNRNFVFDYLLSHPCVDCGESNPVMLEFDHQADKSHDISNLMKGASIKTLKEEISKCEVRCANCHRVKTAIEQGWWIASKINSV